MKKEHVKVLVLPDIHGRKFWKEAFEKFSKEEFPDIHIVFLGDYLDPYTGFEEISKEDAYENFKEILETTANDGRTTLLIGNHDWHYFVSLDRCRMDLARQKDIEHVFTSNIDKFKLAKIIEVNDCKYLFTHAGITNGWLDDIQGNAEFELTNGKGLTEGDKEWLNKLVALRQTKDYEILNECLKNYDQRFYEAPISMISRERGGWDWHGSCIWADVYEHLYGYESPLGVYQIFGHTLTYPNGQYGYKISPNWAMLDASQAFIIDGEGNIEPLKNLEE